MRPGIPLWFWPAAAIVLVIGTAASIAWTAGIALLVCR